MATKKKAKKTKRAKKRQTFGSIGNFQKNEDFWAKLKMSHALRIKS